MNENIDELLTITQLQEMFQVSRATIYEFLNQPENPLPVSYLSDRSPRFKRSVVEEWVEKQFVLLNKDKEE